jgi:hypothetical protein
MHGPGTVMRGAGTVMRDPGTVMRAPPTPAHDLLPNAGGLLASRGF